MKILLLDISGKVTKYSFYVGNIIHDYLDKENSIDVYASFYSSDEKNYNKFNHGMEYHRLLNIVPIKYKSSFSIFKRLLKSVEVLLNYIYIIFQTKIKRFDVLHTQFIPFADFIDIEYYIFKSLKFICPHVKLILTIHDVLPHDLNPDNLESYCSRYSKVASLFDAYMVHTNSCKNDVISYLKLAPEKIHISFHPIFKSAYVTPSDNLINSQAKIKIIMFGLQTPYKGTDILVKAIELIPREYKEKLEITIAGTISEDYLLELKKINVSSNIKWYPYFVPEEQLDNMINASNIIILPYRSISQSGVLLLSLYFKKIIITSNLPSFIESLEGYKKEWFFESENPDSLAKLLESILEGHIDVNEQQTIINSLNEKYSPYNFATKTIDVYNKLTK